MFLHVGTFSVWILPSWIDQTGEKKISETLPLCEIKFSNRSLEMERRKTICKAISSQMPVCFILLLLFLFLFQMSKLRFKEVDNLLGSHTVILELDPLALSGSNSMCSHL